MPSLDDYEVDPPSDEDLEDDEDPQAALRAALADDDDEAAEPDSSSFTRSQTAADIERLLSDEPDAAKAAADKKFAAQMAEATKLQRERDGDEDPAPPTALEMAAAKAAQMNADQLREMLRSGNEALERKARAGQEGFDREGDPVVVEKRLDPMSLPTAAFNEFMYAVQAGGARAGKTPEGWTPEGWAKAIDSALGQ